MNNFGLHHYHQYHNRLLERTKLGAIVAMEMPSRLLFRLSHLTKRKMSCFEDFQ
jgi:hypothetical protein